MITSKSGVIIDFLIYCSQARNLLKDKNVTRE